MSETKGRCRREMEEHYVDKRVAPNRSEWILAGGIDRLAADVAAVKAKVGAVSPDDVRHFVESEKAWVTPPWQRAKWDEALAIICDGGDWGRGNNFDHGVLGALVIWADKEMDRLTAERDAAIRDRDEARAEVERLKAELAARRSMAPVVDAGGGGAGVSWCRGSVRGGAVNDPEFDRMARVVSLWVFVAAVVGGLAVGIWSALEIFVLFDGNFRR